MGSASKNIRGFASLILANRKETVAIPEIMKLASDERSMVRSCAIGALGHLRAQEAKKIFLESVLDPKLEVRKSAMQAIIDLNMEISENQIKQIISKQEEEKEKDPEAEKLLFKLKKMCSGPERDLNP